MQSAEAGAARGAGVLPADGPERLPRDQRRAGRRAARSARRPSAQRETRGGAARVRAPVAAAASTTAMPAISRCCTPRTNCSARNSPRSAPVRSATPSWSMSTRRWAAVGSAKKRSGLPREAAPSPAAQPDAVPR
ncbi:MAG: hypothetical protein MZW92_51940 [Comamonadaceae bacterium]|nr:hypothetical protein [Comamonadaceae bacterium]